jgi:ArsR family transcriptional regulator
MVSSALAQEISLLQADFCFALADPTRILILYTLADSPRNVGEIGAQLDLSQPTTSRHLKILRDRGLVHTIRHGTTVVYHLSDRRLIEALDLLRQVMRERLSHSASLMEAALNSEFASERLHA